MAAKISGKMTSTAHEVLTRHLASRLTRSLLARCSTSPPTGLTLVGSVFATASLDTAFAITISLIPDKPTYADALEQLLQTQLQQWRSNTSADGPITWSALILNAITIERDGDNTSIIIRPGTAETTPKPSGEPSGNGTPAAN